MTNSEVIPFSKLLKKQVEISSGLQASSQISLFPYHDYRLVVLVNIDAINGNQLLDLLVLSNPEVVFDLRPCPRFDLEGINRSVFFKNIQNSKIKYYDLASTNGIQTSDDPKLHPIIAAELISKKLTNLTRSGPVFVFLSSSRQVSTYEVTFPTALRPIPKNGWDVYHFKKLLHESRKYSRQLVSDDD